MHSDRWHRRSSAVKSCSIQPVHESRTYKNGNTRTISTDESGSGFEAARRSREGRVVLCSVPEN